MNRPRTNGDSEYKKKKRNGEIKVKDNGTGISQKVMIKYFSHFFTTKPEVEQD